MLAGADDVGMASRIRPSTFLAISGLMGEPSSDQPALWLLVLLPAVWRLLTADRPGRDER